MSAQPTNNETRGMMDPRNTDPRPTTYAEWEDLEEDRDALRAELERTKVELERVRGLLMVALPHVEASAGAQHLMDGFRPRKRPLDDAVEEIRAALERKDGA